MNEKATSTPVGYALAITQGVLYSSMGVFCKLIYAAGLNSSQTLILRMAFTILYLGVFLLIWRKYPLFSRNRNTYIQAGFFFVSAWVYLLAVEHMNAGLVTCIFYTFPAVVAVLNALIFKERITWRIVIALMLSIVGIVLVSGILEPQLIDVDPLGILFSVLACLAFAAYSVIIRITSTEESSFTSTFTMSIVCLALSLLFFAKEVPGTVDSINGNIVLLSSGFAVLATILPIVLYIIAVNLIGSTKASILSLVETPASLFMAWIFLGETLTVVQVVGAVVIMASVLVITFKSKTSQKKVE